MRQTLESAERALVCPFCDSDNADVRVEDDHAWVECPTCLAEGPIENTGAEAVERWNRIAGLRAALDAPEEEVPEEVRWWVQWVEEMEHPSTLTMQTARFLRSRFPAAFEEAPR